jgi:hypothetical protein
VARGAVALAAASERWSGGSGSERSSACSGRAVGVQWACSERAAVRGGGQQQPADLVLVAARAVWLVRGTRTALEHTHDLVAARAVVRAHVVEGSVVHLHRQRVWQRVVSAGVSAAVAEDVGSAWAAVDLVELGWAQLGLGLACLGRTISPKIS